MVVSIDPRRVYVRDPAETQRPCVKTGLLGPEGQEYCWWQCTVKVRPLLTCLNARPCGMVPTFCSRLWGMVAAVHRQGVRLLVPDADHGLHCLCVAWLEAISHQQYTGPSGPSRLISVHCRGGVPISLINPYDPDSRRGDIALPGR